MESSSNCESPDPSYKEHETDSSGICNSTSSFSSSSCQVCAPRSRLTSPLPPVKTVLNLAGCESSEHSDADNANSESMESSEETSSGGGGNFEGWSYDAQDSSEVALVQSIHSNPKEKEKGPLARLHRNTESSVSSSILSSSVPEVYSDEDRGDPGGAFSSAFAPSPERSFVTTKSGRKSVMAVDLQKAKKITSQAIKLEEAKAGVINHNRPDKGLPTCPNKTEGPELTKGQDLASILAAPRNLLLDLVTSKKRTAAPIEWKLSKKPKTGK